MALYDDVINILSNLSSMDLLAIHNNYCYQTNQFDLEIIPMSQFDDTMSDSTPTDIVTLAIHGDFNPDNEYFNFGVDGNLISFNTEDLEEYIYISDIANEIVARMDAFKNPDIQAILDAYEGEL